MERSFAASEALREREKWSRLAVAAGGVGTFDADLVGGASRFSVDRARDSRPAADQPLTSPRSRRMLLEDDQPDFERRAARRLRGRR